jgi:hypothetical protein
VDVVRALLTTIDVLESVNARPLRRAQLPESVGKTWTEEERQFKEEFADGEAVPLIAHQRTTQDSFLVSGVAKGKGVSARSRSPQVIVEVDSGGNV